MPNDSQKWADGRLTGFDLETSGVDPMSCLPVQFAFVTFEHRTQTSRRHGLIDPGIPIPPETTAIHGITDEDVKARGGSLTRNVAGIANYLLDLSRDRVPVVAMNAAFDLTIIDVNCRALDSQHRGLRDLGWNGVVIDPFIIDKHVDQWRRGSRRLSALCEHYSVPHPDPHKAYGDAVAVLDVALAIADRYPEIGDADPEVLHALQIGWRKEQQRDYNLYRIEKGEEPIRDIEDRWPMFTDEEVVLP